MDEESGLQLAHRLASVSAAALRETDGEALLLGAFVHGSLAFADAFVPGLSDVDVLLVSDAQLSDAQIVALTGAAQRLAEETPSDFDLRIVSKQTAARPTRAPMLEFYVERHGSATLEMGSRSPEPDLLVEFSVVRRHGRVIVGPSPAKLISEPPAAWILDHGDEALRRWQGLVDDDAHAELMVLTACRIWLFAIEGDHCSRGDAGRWALAQDPSLTAVEAALARRVGDTERAITPGAIARVLAEARRSVSEAQAR